MLLCSCQGVAMQLPKCSEWLFDIARWLLEHCLAIPMPFWVDSMMLSSC